MIMEVISKECVLSYFLIIIHVSHAATHWVVTEDGKIAVQDDSVFQLRHPYDLMSLLQQEKRAQTLASIKSQLIAQKDEIESDPSAAPSAPSSGTTDGSDDIEQMIYQNNEYCHSAGKPLTQFDLYIGTQLFYVPDDGHGDGHGDRVMDSVIQRKSGNNYVKIVVIEDRNERFVPNCSEMMTLDFSMSSFEHLHSIRERNNLMIEEERDIHSTITNLIDITQFGDALYEALKENTTSWLLHTMASYYWRAVGNAPESVECLRRALHLCPYKHKHIPLTSLGNILHRSKHSEEAAIVMHAAIDVSPDNVISHYTLGNIYAVMADYNKSVICFDNVLKLDPSYEDARKRKDAVLCHANVERALKAQHDTLQKTLEELQGYQKQQELWLQHQQKLLSEQAPPSVILEQRLHYREFKIREIIESTNHRSSGNSGSGVPPNPDQMTDTVPTCGVNSAPSNGKGRGSGGVSDCRMVPILIPITFVPPS